MRSHHRSRYLLPLLVAVATLATAASASAATGVSVFPSPGTKYNLPGTQITFRGVAPGSIGSVTVVGSKTGAHTGRIAADSDGHGGSFLPTTPFAPGETVTVTTHLDILGAKGGTFHFAICKPFGKIGAENIPLVPAGRNGLQHFHSRPDLTPASVTVTKRGAPAAPGDIFVGPQQGPVQNGPMILDPSGNLIWFKPIPKNQIATDVRVQRLGSQPVLTWFQGYTNHGSGRGVGVIYNTHYQQIATVRAGNGLQGVDLHEFLITPQGDAYIIAASPVHWPRYKRPLMDSVVQEIDIKTGLVLFEWHALDHVPLSESFFKKDGQTGLVDDPYHLNSIALTSGGNLIVSMRNTWAEYEINHQTGAVMWTLGSNRSSFHLGPGAQTAFQHSFVPLSNDTFTAFDDGAGPPTIHRDSRGVVLALNTKKKTVTLVKQYEHSPPLHSIFEGNLQALPGGDVFSGWGSQPYFSEFTPSGKLDFDAHFTAPTTSYRAYRFPWSAQPTDAPALAASNSADGIATVYASWNGATDVSSWRVLAGTGPGALQTAGSVGKRGFETAIPVHTGQPAFQVQALGSKGQVLSTSGVANIGTNRISIFGNAFVSGGGTGGIEVGCFSPSPCHTATTVTAGRSVIARAGSEFVPADSAGSVLFTLSGSGRRMLSRARGHELPVTVSVRDSAGASNSLRLNLISYVTHGSGPRYTVKQASNLQLLSKVAFASPGGVGGVFAGCSSAQPCHASAVVTAGKTVIARTGSEFLGAHDFGFIIFSLTSAGNRMLAHARGNQLPVTVSVSGGGGTATATIPLDRWG